MRQQLHIPSPSTQPNPENSHKCVCNLTGCLPAATGPLPSSTTVPSLVVVVLVKTEHIKMCMCKIYAVTGRLSQASEHLWWRLTNNFLLANFDHLIPTRRLCRTTRTGRRERSGEHAAVGMFVASHCCLELGYMRVHSGMHTYRR